MIKKFSKPIKPDSFQADQIQNLIAYQEKMEQKAKKYFLKSKIKASKCPVCLEKSFEPFITVYEWSYLKCKKCSHVFLEEYLGKKELVNYYSEDAGYASSYTNIQQIKYRLNKIAKPKVKFVLESINKKDGGEWLDIGSAIGDIPAAVNSHKGWNAEGIEISSHSVETSRRVFGQELINLQFIDYVNKNEGKRFDVLSFFGYLGLIHDPISELKVAAKLINKNGHIVIGETNANSFSTLVQKDYPNLALRHLIPPHIIHAFNIESMKNKLTELSFDTVAIWNFGLDFHEYVKIMTLNNKQNQPSELLSFFKKNANKFQGIIDKQMMGDYFILIAKKIN